MGATSSSQFGDIETAVRVNAALLVQFPGKLLLVAEQFLERPFHSAHHDLHAIEEIGSQTAASPR